MVTERRQRNTPIAQQVRACLKEFQTVIASFSKALSDIKAKLPQAGLVDELGRFRVWSGNVGAHRGGRSSLDHKLREASHIHDRVIELLQTIVADLAEAQAIITGARQSWEDMPDSASESDEAVSDVKVGGTPLTTELAQLLSNIAEINTCLLRLSVSIRNPPPHDQFKGSKNINFSHYEDFDVDHVRNKFPNAAAFLVTRLGKAISRRRRFIRYREEHRKKYEQGLDDDPTEPARGPAEISGLSEHKAKTNVESTIASWSMAFDTSWLEVPVHVLRSTWGGRTTNLTRYALDHLESWLDANQHNPYPNAETKSALAKESGITVNKVSTWFANARARQSRRQGNSPGENSDEDVESVRSLKAGHSSKTGKKQAGKSDKVGAHLSPPDCVSLFEASVLTNDDTATDTDEWHCTFCRVPLTSKSWRRHEETQHHPKSQLTCLAAGPRVPSEPSSGSSICAFYQIAEPTEEQFQRSHQISECTLKDSQ